MEKAHSPKDSHTIASAGCARLHVSQHPKCQTVSGRTDLPRTSRILDMDRIQTAQMADVTLPGDVRLSHEPLVSAAFVTHSP